MPVKIRLQRHGKKGKPFYWIVAADTRSKRDGRFLEKLGSYNPNVNPAQIEINVDFWAAWCGPCRMVGPIIDEISSEYAGKAVVGKVDVDANQEFAAKYGVRNIPTVLLFKDGEVVGRQVGVATKAAYADSIDALL